MNPRSAHVFLELHFMSLNQVVFSNVRLFVFHESEAAFQLVRLFNSIWAFHFHWKLQVSLIALHLHDSSHASHEPLLFNLLFKLSSHCPPLQSCPSIEVSIPFPQTWPWRKSESTSAPRRKPPTWRSAASPPPSPSQRPRFPPAPAAAPAAPRPPPSPQKPPSSCRCRRSAPGRSPPRRPWPCRIRAGGTRSSSCPASFPGTPARSRNEGRAAPLVKPPPRSPCGPAEDAWAARPTTSPSASWSEAETLHRPGDPSPLSRLADCYSQSLQPPTGSLMSIAKRPARCKGTARPIESNKSSWRHSANRQTLSSDWV